MCNSGRKTYPIYRERAVHKKVTRDEYSFLLSDFNYFLMEVVLAGHEVTLPKRLGSMKITGRIPKVTLGEDGQIKGLAIDYQKTKQLWEENPQAKEERRKVYHANSHSGKMIYKFNWSRKGVAIPNKTLYSLTVARANKRHLATLIKSGKEY